MSNKFVLNQSPRAFYLKPGPDGKPRVLAAGRAIETLDDAEYTRLLRYRGVIDANTLVPRNDKQIAEMQAQISKLEAENAQLQSQVSAIPEETEAVAPESVEEDEAPTTKKGSKKGR